MNSKHVYNWRQLIALAFVALLSPSLRLFPAGSVQLAGRAAWLSAPAAGLLMLLYLRFLCLFLGARREREGLAELTLRALGQKAGRAALVLIPLWLLLYAGFVLRSGADRFITTIFPLSSPGVFTVTMGLVSLIAALGSARSLVRVARLALPALLGILLLILAFALFKVEKLNLLPVTVADTGPVLLGTLPVIDVLSAVCYLICFLAGPAPKEEGPFRSGAKALLGTCLLLTALCVAVVGSFGAELTGRLTRPFFSLVRNLVFFNSLERIEALVVTLWVLPDFLLTSLLLFTAQFCLRLALGERPAYHGEKRLELSGRRWVVWACAAAAIGCGLLIAPDPDSLSFWSEKLIPGLNMLFAFIVLPAIWAAGRLRKKL